MRSILGLILGSLLCGGTALANTVIPPIVSIATWGDPTPVPLNHRGLVRIFRMDAAEVTLLRDGETPDEIALGEELADDFFAFDPGPLAEGEVLSLAVECNGTCDGEPFEAVVGGFVDESAPTIELAGEPFFDDEVQRIPRIPISMSDDTSPTLSVIAEIDDGAHMIVASVIGAEQTRFVAPDGPARDVCFRLHAIDWAANRSEPTARSCVTVGSSGCASTPFALPVALTALSIVRRRRSLRC